MFSNSLQLGVVVSLKDAFSRPAANAARGFARLDDAAYRASRGIRRSLKGQEVGFADVTRTMAAAAAVLAVMSFPIAKATQFASAIGEIKTIADQTTLNIDTLRQSILDISSGLGQDPFASANAVYEAVSSGFENTADAIQLTNEAAKSGVATLTDTDTALKGLLSTMNAYKMGASDAAHVSDMFFETIKLGRMRGKDFAESIGMFAPVAGAARMPMEQMLGSLSALTLSGLNASQANMYMRQVVLGLEKPTPGAKKAASKYGIKLGAEELARRHGDVYGMVTDAWKATGQGKHTEDFQRMFGGKQSWTALASLLGRDNGALWGSHIAQHKNTMVFDDFGTPMSSRERAIEIMNATTAQQLKILKSNITAMVISFGDAAQKGLYPIVKVITMVVSGFRAVVTHAPIVAKAFYGLASAATFALIAFAGIQLWAIKISPAFQDLMGKLEMFKYKIGTVTLTSKNLIPSLMGVAGILMAVGYGLKYAYDQGGAFHDWVNHSVLLIRALWTGLNNMTGLIASIPSDMAQALQDNGMLTTYVTWIQTLARVKFFFESLFQGVAAGFKQMAANIRQGLRVIANFLDAAGLKGLANSVRDFVRGLNINGSAVATWQKVGFMVGKIIAAIIAIYTVTKAWRGAVLLVQAALWLLTKPITMFKRVLWDGPIAAFKTMRGYVTDIVGALMRMGRMAVIKMLGQRRIGGGAKYSSDIADYVFRGDAGGNFAGHRVPSSLRSPRQLGLWNRAMAGLHGRAGSAGGSLASLWDASKVMQGNNIARLRGLGGKIASGHGAFTRFGEALMQGGFSHGKLGNPTVYNKAKQAFEILHTSKRGNLYRKAGNAVDANGVEMLKYYYDQHFGGRQLRMGARNAGRYARIAVGRTRQGIGSGFEAVQGAGQRVVGAMRGLSFAKLKSGLSGLKSAAVAGFGVMKAGISGFKTALISTVSFLFTNPIGWAILAIVGTIAILYKNWDKVKQAFKSVLGMKLWQKLADGFNKYLMPPINWLLKKLSFITDLVGITNNSADKWRGDPATENAKVKKSYDPATGYMTWKSATDQYAVFTKYLKANQNDFESGNMGEKAARQYTVNLRLAEAIKRNLPAVQKASKIGEAALNAAVNSGVDLSKKGWALVGQTESDMAQESADADAAQGKGPKDDPPGKSGNALYDGAYAGSRDGHIAAARTLQSSMQMPKWSGDKWLVNGKSPYAGVEARFMQRAMQSNGRGGLSGSSQASEAQGLRKDLVALGQGVQALATKENVIHIMVDGKKVARAVYRPLAQAATSATTRGAN